MISSLLQLAVTPHHEQRSLLSGCQRLAHAGVARTSACRCTRARFAPIDRNQVEHRDRERRRFVAAKGACCQAPAAMARNPLCSLQKP